MAEDVKRTPPPPKKEWDVGQQPTGLPMWAALIAVGIINEVWALVTHRTTFTLSAVFWWAAGIPHTLRWWLVVTVNAGFWAWFVAHVAARNSVGGTELVYVLASALVLAVVAWGALEVLR